MAASRGMERLCRVSSMKLAGEKVLQPGLETGRSRRGAVATEMARGLRKVSFWVNNQRKKGGHQADRHGMCPKSELFHEPFTWWSSLGKWPRPCLPSGRPLPPCDLSHPTPLLTTPSHFPAQTVVGPSRGSLFPRSLQAKGKLDSRNAFAPNTCSSSRDLPRAGMQSPAPWTQAMCPTAFVLEPAHSAFGSAPPGRSLWLPVPLVFLPSWPPPTLSPDVSGRQRLEEVKGTFGLTMYLSVSHKERRRVVRVHTVSLKDFTKYVFVFVFAGSFCFSALPFSAYGFVLKTA